jgi:hypothetical protein
MAIRREESGARSRGIEASVEIPKKSGEVQEAPDHGILVEKRRVRDALLASDS